MKGNCLLLEVTATCLGLVNSRQPKNPNTHLEGSPKISPISPGAPRVVTFTLQIVQLTTCYGTTGAEAWKMIPAAAVAWICSFAKSPPTRRVPSRGCRRLRGRGCANCQSLPQAELFVRQRERPGLHSQVRRPWGFSPKARRGSQGASRAAPRKSGLHARGEGERVLALQSREG